VCLLLPAVDVPMSSLPAIHLHLHVRRPFLVVHYVVTCPQFTFLGNRSNTPSGWRRQYKFTPTFSRVFAALCSLARLQSRGSCCRAVSGWVSVTFVYCVETAEDTAIVAMECE